ncbi:hypothetical protein ACLOJK_002575 [Asimina triloba]
MAALKAEKSPSFFKFFLPGVTDQYLRIPQAFIKHINHGAYQTVSVKGPSGNVWHLDLVEDAKGLLFQDGWKEFARENCLEVGYLLVFRYDGNSCTFAMRVFDTSGCDNGDRIVAKSCKESSGISVPKVAASLVSQKSGQQNRGERLIGLRRRVTRSSCKVERNQSAKRALENDGRVGTNKRRMMNTSFKSQTNPSESRQAKHKHKTVLKPRCGSLTSQRRNVTEEERTKAVDKAKSLKLQNPSVAGLPRKFVRSYLPRKNCLMTVWDPTGRKWNINHVHGALSAGWKYFCLHNNLEEGDVCVFEHVENHELRVHIFRVVEEITPLINNVLQGKKN